MFALEFCPIEHQRNDSTGPKMFVFIAKDRGREYWFYFAEGKLAVQQRRQFQAVLSRIQRPST